MMSPNTLTNSLGPKIPINPHDDNSAYGTAGMKRQLYGHANITTASQCVYMDSIEGAVEKKRIQGGARAKLSEAEAEEVRRQMLDAAGRISAASVRPFPSVTCSRSPWMDWGSRNTI